MKNPDRRTFVTLGVGALAVAALPSAMRPRRVLVRRRIPVMGTIAEVAIPTQDSGWAHEAIDAAFGALRRVEATMTRFRSDSDVGRLNLSGGVWVPVSTDTGHVLAAAQEWASRSGGRFDPCLGNVTRLWDAPERVTRGRIGGGGRPLEGRGPEGLGSGAGDELWRSLEIESWHASARARLTGASASVDLGGIAKGFAVDVAADALRYVGVTDGLVNVGGDLVALGSDEAGEGWLIGVQAPDDPEGLAATLTASDEAIATSGDYVRFFESGGRHYHHLLDPMTGAPRETAMRSLTVRADRCLHADAAATALFGAPVAVAEAVSGGAPSRVSIIHTIEEVRG